MPWGDWHDLDTADQTRRYNTIARLLADLHADHAVLDVGCGTARLRSFLPPSCLYLGVDCERDALAHANGAVVLHSRAEALPPISIETVVFNEMLYYCKDPVQVFQSLSHQARVVVCSIYQDPKPVSRRKRLAHVFRPRRPVSNQHCEAQIRTAMRNGWRIVDDHACAPWHIWSALNTSRLAQPAQ